MTPNPLIHLTNWWLHWAKQTSSLPDYSQSIKCAKCGAPVGRKGDRPARKRPDKTYVHEGC